MSRQPLTKWAQRTDQVLITFELPDAKGVELTLQADGHLRFSATGADNMPYEIDFNLHDKVNVDESKAAVCSSSIKCIVKKAEGKWWSRLLSQEGSLPVFLEAESPKWINEDGKPEENVEDWDLSTSIFSKVNLGCAEQDVEDDSAGDDVKSNSEDESDPDEGDVENSEAAAEEDPDEVVQGVMDADPMELIMRALYEVMQNRMNDPTVAEKNKPPEDVWSKINMDLKKKLNKRGKFPDGVGDGRENSEDEAEEDDLKVFTAEDNDLEENLEVEGEDNETEEVKAEEIPYAAKKNLGSEENVEEESDPDEEEEKVEGLAGLSTSDTQMCILQMMMQAAKYYNPEHKPKMNWSKEKTKPRTLSLKEWVEENSEEDD